MNLITYREHTATLSCPSLGGVGLGAARYMLPEIVDERVTQFQHDLKGSGSFGHCLFPDDAVLEL